MPRAILSRLTDPFVNLALETVLFKHKRADERLLFMYFNSPCVVIGRNQNPWAECDVQASVPILRRRSGGGAVVHDLENANFCVQFPRVEFSRSKHLEMLVSAFPSLGLEINSRNDLVLGGKKVSGSSYKIEKDRAYHHATLLLNADLHAFGPLLRPNPRLGEIVTSSATESVKSPVTNTKLSKQDFINGCVAAFSKLYGPSPVEEATADWVTAEVQEEAAELRSWAWIYGKTPKFTLRTARGDVEVVRGCVNGMPLGELGTSLAGAAI